MKVNEHDLEQLELYLDHELVDNDVRQLDERLAVDSSLAGALQQLRGQRSLRLGAMSTAYDSDAASIARLVASVRIAQANEAMQRRRFTLAPQVRSVIAAAACVAVGLLLGVTLQNRHNGAADSVVTSSMSTGSFLNSERNLQPQGAYAVSVLDGSRREVMKVRFSSKEQAQQFMERINNRTAGAPVVHVGDAKILDEPY